MGFDFTYTEDQQLMRDSIHKALKQLEPKHQALREEIFKAQNFPAELWKVFCDLGLMGSIIPEKYGGEGLDLLTMTLGLEIFSSYGFANSIAVITGMDATCILNHGNEEQKQHYLPKIARGELTFCYGHTEPDAGSNVFNTQTFAQKNGNDYVINGQKVFISAVDVTDYMLLVTRTTSLENAKKVGDPRFGISMFIVDTKSEGIKLQELPMQGLEGMRQYAVFLDNVHVPAENLLGEENMGVKIIFDSLNPERILASGISTGMVDFLLDRATRYANERKVFGDRLIGSYQAISHPLAEVKIEQEAARLLTYRAAWAYDQGLSPAVVGNYANMAKLKAADVGIMAADRAIETLGGYGFSEEYEIIQFWTTARVLKTAPITREMILNFVAEHNLKLPRSY